MSLFLSCIGLWSFCVVFFNFVYYCHVFLFLLFYVSAVLSFFGSEIFVFVFPFLDFVITLHISVIVLYGIVVVRHFFSLVV